jgi:hypothetical protein
MAMSDVASVHGGDMWIKFRGIDRRWEPERFFNWNLDDFLNVREAMKEDFLNRYADELEEAGVIVGFTPNDHARMVSRVNNFDWDGGSDMPMMGVFALTQDVQYAEGSYQEGPTTKWKRLKSPYPPGSVI